MKRMTAGAWTLGHRAELDGVRGIAILLVLASHMQTPGLYAGGSVGVTLFFVLSGFLISSLLIEEHDRSGRINIGAFYVRRVRRLAPAFVVWASAIAALGATINVDWFFTWPDLFAAAGYFGNWTRAAGGDLAAFNGTWSLAVEEQFYLVWPFVAIVGLRRGVRAFGVAAGFALGVSLLVRAFLVWSGAPLVEVYYRTDTSAVGLAAGALLAAVVHVRSPGRRTVPAWVWLGLLLGLSALDRWGFDFLPVFATVAGVGLLHSAASSRSGWLSGVVLGWFGRRAYGLYLWHMVPAWLLRDLWPAPWVVVVVTVLPFSVVMAEVSWRFVERPFLVRRARVVAREIAPAHP